MTTPDTFSFTYSGSLANVAVLKALVDGMVASAAAPIEPAAAGSAPVPVSGAPATPVTTAAPVDAAPAVDAITAKYFPDNVGLSAFPSPENSSIVRLGTLISGRPYLRDNAGAVHQMVPATADVPNGYTINGAAVHGGGSDGAPITQLIVRQGEVYCKVSPGGQIQHFNPAGGSLYSATLPAAFATDAAGETTSTVAVSSVTAPADPTPGAPAPGASGKMLEVGAGAAFATITAAFAAAAAGDTIHIAAGVYKEAPPAVTVPLYVKADAGAILDATGLTTLARGKGAIVPAADMVIEGLEILGAGMTETEAGGTAAIRPDLGCGYLTVRNCHLHDNQNGVACGDVPVVVTIDGGLFEANGLPAGNAGHGYTHNVYVSNGTIRAQTQGGFVSQNPNGGHAFKTRAFEHVLSNSTFIGGGDAAVIDVPNGSTKCTLDGVTITKPAGAANHAIIDYATDDASAGNSGMFITNSTINALCDNPFVLIGAGSVITVDAATKAKTTGTITAQGGTLVGL